MTRRFAIVYAIALLLLSSPGLASAQDAQARTAPTTRVLLPRTQASVAPVAGRPAETPLTMRLSSSITAVGTTVRSLIRLVPHHANRTLRIVIDSGDYYRSSDVQLEGAGAPRSFFFDWRSLPAGDYEVVATVLGQDGPRGQSRLPLNVFGAPSR